MLTAELRHLFQRTRVRALLAVMFAIPVVLAIAVKVNGGVQAGDGPTFLAQATQNGIFAALAGLTVAIPFFLPLTVSVVAGDTIAGEASLGTLRYLLTRPSGRGRLLGVKAVTTLVYCLTAALAVAIGGLLAGLVLFPHGHVISLSGTSLSLTAGVERTLLAAVIVGVSLLGLAAIGIFVSTLTDTPVGAMAVTAGIAVLSLVLDSIPELSFLHPWLLTHQELAFGDLLRTPVHWGNIVRDIVIQCGYVAVFGCAAWARFTTRDVLA